MSDRDGFLSVLLGDGRALFKLIALGLMGAGRFVIFQAATGQFLPHDAAYLGMAARSSARCTAAASCTS